MEAGDYNYSVVLPFERDWDERKVHEYIQERWTDTFGYSAIYVVLVFLGRAVMMSRTKFDLRWLLAIWSGTLAAFSIFGTIRVVPEFVSAIQNHGLQYSVCDPSYFKGVTAFWAAMFTFSKVFELGDTAFIVLRKQKLIFLHWYHHITVLMYVWYSYIDHTAPARWFMNMNYTVHSFMYTYYCLRALQVKLPSFISMFITSIQLIQMIFGVAINVYVYNVKARGEFCQQSDENLKYSSLMYFSYFLLFANFFCNTYIFKSGRPKQKAT